MESDSADDELFKEYMPLAPLSRSLAQYVVFLLHLTTALVISVLQFNEGLIEWVRGFGIVAPVLLTINGAMYLFAGFNSWNKEQMVPYISRIISTTEIETDRFLHYHRRGGMYLIIGGWFVILVCQIAWSYGLTLLISALSIDASQIFLLLELVLSLLIAGPILLYFILLVVIGIPLEKLFRSKYKDIEHLIDIDEKWHKEHNRRKKKPESVQEQDAPSDSFHFY